MKRRTLLATLPALAATTGCLSGDSSDSPVSTQTTTTTTTTPSPSTSFGLASGSCQFTRSEYSRESHALLDDPPEITFQPEDGRVVVTGAMRYGSSSCNEIAVSDVSRDGEGLHVKVKAGEKKDAPPTCTSDLAAGHYRFACTFEDQYPAAVSVSETNVKGTTREQTKSAPSL